MGMLVLDRTNHAFQLVHQITRNKKNNIVKYEVVMSLYLSFFF